jgi:alanyl-tRNA synthetase
LTELYPYLTDNFGNDWYPELKARADTIKSIIHSEETIFLATLDKGLGLLESVFSQPNLQTAKEIPAETAFKLYDTYGFPLDLTTIIAAERGWHINLAGTYSTNWMHAIVVSVNLIVSLHFASCRG